MEEHQRVENYTKEVAQRLLEAQSRVIEATNKAKAYDKQRFDASRVNSTYKVGDIVWLEVEKRPLQIKTGSCLPLLKDITECLNC